MADVYYPEKTSSGGSSIFTYVSWWLTSWAYADGAAIGGTCNRSGSNTGPSIQFTFTGPCVITVHTVAETVINDAALWWRYAPSGGGANVDEDFVSNGDSIIVTVAASGSHLFTIGTAGATQPSGGGAFKFDGVTIGDAVTPPPTPDPPAPGVILDPPGEIDADPIDIAGDIMEWVIRRGSSAEITGAAQPGSATVRLRNTDDQYNPENGSSPLIDYLRDGTAIWLGINNDGLLTGDEPRGLFGGRITDFTVIPYAGQGTSPWVELQCEDALGWYGRLSATVPFEQFRTHKELREAILDAAGETRTILDDEIYTMPLAGADGKVLDALDEINRANGTRHFAHPANSATDWYAYTTYNRQHGLSGVADATMANSDILAAGTPGWPLRVDTVINQQRATFTPVTFTPGTTVVWTANPLPIIVDPTRPFELWVDFDDYVRDPYINLSYTGDAPTTQTLEPFGSRAKLTILQAGVGDSTTINHLTVEGSLARRWPDESWRADDTTSQLPPRGVRQGPEIRSEYVGTLATARGIAEHVVWRYADPQPRPTLTVSNWFPEMFDLDLGDVIDVSLAEVGVANQLFEIVGLTHRGVFVTPTRCQHTTEYVLQKSRVQTDPGWFTWDVSDWDGTDVLGY